MKSEFVDLLGNLKAEIASIKEEADAAKAALITLAANHPGTACAIEGEMFRAVVSFSDKSVTDYRAAFDELVERHGLRQDFVQGILTKYTRTAECVPHVRVNARKEA